ncbi:hypothetical protein WG907_11475 [Sphingobium sp. AN558]|uniref:hypothetical protein n=1 Tax=Sphingobium sp. AN558 TaxID=3133442 RepID=UPI0030C563FD
MFVKTRKTAGTSLEVHLGAYCGRDDIVTPITPARPGHRPRNHDGYYNHMASYEIRERQPDFFGRAFKFAFERHPVDKCLSYFAMLRHSLDHKARGNPTEWPDFVDIGVFPVDTGLYAGPDGTLMVDQLYRYEEMDAALSDIVARTGIPNGPLVVREKSGFRKNDIPTFEAVMRDPWARDRIMDAFACTLRHIAY